MLIHIEKIATVIFSTPEYRHDEENTELHTYSIRVVLFLQTHTHSNSKQNMDYNRTKKIKVVLYKYRRQNTKENT